MRGLWVLCRPCLEQERVIRVGEGLERILDDGELPREGRPLVRVPVSGQSAVAPPDGRRVARAAREEERVREAGAPRGDLRQDRPLATASRGGSRGFGAFLRPSVERGTGGRRPSEPRPTRPRLDGGAPGLGRDGALRASDAGGGPVGELVAARAIGGCAGRPREGRLDPQGRGAVRDGRAAAPAGRLRGGGLGPGSGGPRRACAAPARAGARAKPALASRPSQPASGPREKARAGTCDVAVAVPPPAAAAGR